VAIIGSGGQGVVTSDTCESIGLKVPEFDDETKATLKEAVPAHAPVPSNPVDFAGSSRTPLDEARVADALARIDYIDGIICNSPRLQGGVSSGDFARKAIQGAEMLAAIPKQYGKPVITLRWGSDNSADAASSIVKAAGIPSYDSPEQCARAMQALASYAEVRRRLEQE